MLTLFCTALSAVVFLDSEFKAFSRCKSKPGETIHPAHDSHVLLRLSPSLSAQNTAAFSKPIRGASARNLCMTASDVAPVQLENLHDQGTTTTTTTTTTVLTLLMVLLLFFLVLIRSCYLLKPGLEMAPKNIHSPTKLSLRNLCGFSAWGSWRRTLNPKL